MACAARPVPMSTVAALSRAARKSGRWASTRENFSSAAAPRPPGRGLSARPRRTARWIASPSRPPAAQQRHHAQAGQAQQRGTQLEHQQLIGQQARTHPLDRHLPLAAGWRPRCAHQQPSQQAKSGDDPARHPGDARAATRADSTTSPTLRRLSLTKAVPSCPILVGCRYPARRRSTATGSPRARAGRCPCCRRGNATHSRRAR